LFVEDLLTCGGVLNFLKINKYFEVIFGHII